MAHKRTRCENSGCHERAAIFIEGRFYCSNCKPDKIERTAAEEVDIMSDIHIRSKEIIPLEIKNIGPGCTCEPEKKGLWARFMKWLSKDNSPDKCC